MAMRAWYDIAAADLNSRADIEGVLQSRAQLEALLQHFPQVSAAPFGEHGVLRMQLDAGLVAGRPPPVLADAHVPGGDAAHLAIPGEEHFGSRLDNAGLAGTGWAQKQHRADGPI